MRSIFMKCLVPLCLTAAAWGQEGVFTPSLKVTGAVQFWNQYQSNSWDQTVKHVRLKTTAAVDEETLLVVMPEWAPTGFILYDAYAVRDAGDQWALMAGQFKYAFGDERYLTPAQLKRVDYAKMDKFIFPGNSWDMGLEVRKTAGEITLQGDLIQGAGPNVLKDTDGSKDISARIEWKSEGFLFGASYYGGTSNGTGFTTYQNWGGIHARWASEGWDVRAEAALAPQDKSAYLLQAAYKTGDWEPLAFGELGFTGSGESYQLLGAGINFWAASKTRLSLDGILNGVTDFSGPASLILQMEQVF